MSVKYIKYDTQTGKKELVDGVSSFTHNQITPSTEWTINHDLNKRPSVAVVDSAGTLVHGLVKYIDDTQIIIEFKYAFSGMAYLN